VRPGLDVTLVCNALRKLFIQSLTLKAGSVAEVDSWIAAIMSPLEELSRVPGPAGGPAAASDAVPATA
jgi:hypothetical protein